MHKIHHACTPGLEQRKRDEDDGLLYSISWRFLVVTVRTPIMYKFVSEKLL